jgi:YVTN family beta-propeller protein
MTNFLRSGGVVACLVAVALGCGAFQPNAQPMAHTAVLVQPAGENTGPAYLFVSNRFVNAVYRIDLTTQQFTGILVGAGPQNLAASPDGSQVAVCNEADGSVSLIDTAKLHVRTINTGAYPIDVRYSPDGRWLAVANYNDQSVTLIDPGTFETWTVWVGGGPASVSFEARSQFVAVACFGDNDVKLIDVAQQEAVATWDLTAYEPSDETLQPQTISFGPAGSQFAGTMFVGLETTFAESPSSPETYAHSIVVVPFPTKFYDDPTIEPTNVQIVRAGPSPSGFLWNREGSAFLAFNHDYLSEAGVDDTVSELKWTADDDTVGNLGDAIRRAVPEDSTIPRRDPQDSFAYVPFAGLVNLATHWFEQRRFVVGRNPAGAALAPNRDYVAVANQDSHSISLLDLTTNGTTLVPVAANPFAVAFSPSGRYVFVVHETPLMPVSLVDTQTGTSWTLYKSLPMYRWIQ